MKSLFFILFSLIPLLANSEIKVEKDSTTGMKTISSVVSNSENPITEIIFRASSEGEYWLVVAKIDKKCWIFEGQLKLILGYGNISISTKFIATELVNLSSKTEICSTRALFDISYIISKLSDVQEVAMVVDFKNKTSTRWKLPKSILEEWKSVIDLKKLEVIQNKISKKTIDSPMVESEYLPAEDEYVPVDSQPQLIKGAYPEYPESARENDISGKVLLAVLIDRNGKVRKAKVAKSSGHKILDKAALKAAYENTYKPAIGKDGKAVAFWIYYPVHFRLAKKIPSKP